MHSWKSTAAGVPLTVPKPPARRATAPLRLHDGPDRDPPSRARSIPDVGAGGTGRRSAAVLWIDDQVEPGDPSVRLLTSEGFRVDCAASGAAGLDTARRGAHDAIILDLRLPDTSGLALLERLRASGVSVPVLVLTGYGDLESAVAALRLGVVDFQRKPLIADELVAAVRAAVVGSRAGHAAASRPRQPLAPSHADLGESEALYALLARVDRVAESNQESGVTREELVAVLMLAVESPMLGIAGFLACAETLRHTLTAAEAGAPATLVARARDAIGRADISVTSDHFKVRVAFATLEESVSRGVRPTESELGAELGVDPAHLGRLIRSRTGRGFRQWRSAFAMRVAARALADPDVQIAQIAFRSGYEHPSQLDREFRRTFGISPREYRRLRKALAPLMA